MQNWFIIYTLLEHCVTYSNKVVIMKKNPRDFEKMHSGKIVKQKEEIVSTEKILYWWFCNII